MDAEAPQVPARPAIWGRLRTWIVAALVLGLLSLFLGLSSEVFWDPAPEREQFQAREVAVLRAIQGLRQPAMTRVAIDVTALGSVTVLTLLVGVTLLVTALRRDRQGFWLMAGAGLGAALGTRLLKHFFDRPRPDIIPALAEAAGYGYPSGHSFGAAAVYVCLGVLLGRYLASTGQRVVLFAVLGAVVLAVGLSRIYLGVHWPTDVAAGICLGTAWAVGVGATSLALAQPPQAAGTAGAAV